MAELILTSLEKALNQLELGLVEYAKTHNEVVRDGVIQRFEYTIDVAWKLLQRYLKDIAQSDEANMRTKKDLFREAARLKLIDNAEHWISHYNARNETSHGYDNAKAEAVFAHIPAFLTDAKKLYHALHHHP
jgi:nucleotidyltransferase substrate binding protein (TIGR01987 family)